MDRGSKYGFDDPTAITVAGADLWVTNFKGNSVTEVVAATGRLVRRLSGANYGFANPAGIAFDGTYLWSPSPPATQ